MVNAATPLPRQKKKSLEEFVCCVNIKDKYERLLVKQQELVELWERSRGAGCEHPKANLPAQLVINSSRLVQTAATRLLV